jgi:hypothetical protein
MSDIDWGDAPTWIAGLFAATAAYYTRGMLRSQQQQIREQRAFIAEQSANLSLERQALQAQAEERRYAQARLIEVQRWQNSLRVTNHSDAPIKDVTVTFGDREAAHAHHLVSAGVGDRLVARGQFALPVDLIGPGRLYSFVDVNQQADAVAVLHFTDGDGNRWQLDEHGRLDPALEA